MTPVEFSNNFDTLLDSFKENGTFGEENTRISIACDEYEKSVYLTQALEELVTEYYDSQYKTHSFEMDEKTRRYLDALVKPASPSISTSSSTIPDSFQHSQYTLPNDCWYIIYEQVAINASTELCLDGRVLEVIPTTHDEYNRIRKNPFKWPTDYRALRLDNGKLSVELVSKYNLKDYFIRYIKRPQPIILTPITEDLLTINGVSTISQCELAEPLHKIILDRAVRLALMSKTNNLLNTK